MVRRMGKAVGVWIVAIVAATFGGARMAAAAPAPFPVAGTVLTFASADPKETWTTTLTAHGTLMQYVPHNDILNYATKAGFAVRADGIYVAAEALDGDPVPAPVKAIALPLKTGGTGTVPGMFATTYTVGSREKITTKAGTFDAWKIAITDKVNPAGAVWYAPTVGIVKIKLPTGRVDELVKVAPPAALGACEVADKHGEDPAACTKLGEGYMVGTGVTKNDATARALFERSCTHGDQTACADLGFLLERGRGGATDAKRAVALYTKACDSNVPGACFNLGAATEFGQLGIRRDAIKAGLLYDKACKLGLAPGCVDYKRLTGQ